MKTLEVIFKNGHLLNKKDKTAIYLKEGSELVIVSNPANIINKENIFEIEQPKFGDELLKSHQKAFPNCRFVKLLDKDQFFVFRVGLGRRKDGFPDNQYLFKCKIYEDLYMRESANGSGDWKLLDCVCQTIDCLEGDIIFSQDIPGNSLNKLYNNTVMYYFPLMRSGSCNSFRDFYLIEKTGSPSLFNFKNNFNLEKLRIEKINYLKKQKM